MSQKEPLSRSVFITGVVVPLALGAMAIGGNILTTQLQSPSGTPATTTPTPVPTFSVESNQEQPTSTPAIIENGAEEGDRDVVVSAGDTANVFSGKVFIALIKTESEGEPVHDTVYATLSTDDEGVKDRRLKGVDAGFACPFNGYKVRVMSVETNKARFRVTRILSSEPEPTRALGH